MALSQRRIRVGHIAARMTRDHCSGWLSLIYYVQLKYTRVYVVCNNEQVVLLSLCLPVD